MRYLLLLLCIVMAASASAQVQFLGSPTTTVRNRGNFVSDSLFYLPKRQKLPTDTGAIRYAISDSSVYVWTGYQWNKLSPGAFVAISDTASMLNPYTRGSGTVNYLPKFTGTRTFGNSQLQDDGYKATLGGQFYFNPTKKSFSIGADDSTRNISITTYGDAIKINQLDTLTKNNIIELQLNKSVSTDTRHAGINFLQSNGNAHGSYRFYTSDTIANRNYHSWHTASTPGNQLERMRLKQDGELLIGSSSDAGAYALQVAGSIYNTTGAVFATSSGGLSIGTTTTYNNYILNNAGASQPVLALQNNGTGSASTDGFQLSVAGNHAYLWNYEDALMLFGTNGTERMRIQGNGEVLIGSTTDAGAYALQVAGSIYNTTGAVFAASSGDVGIGRTSPTARLSIAERGASNAPLMDFYGNAGNSNYMWTTWYTSTGSALSRLNVNGTVSTSFGTGTSSPLIFITNDNDRMTIKSDGEVLIGSSSDAGTFALQVTGAIYNTTTLTTGAPTSGTAKPWRLGEAATVSPTSPNRTIRVEIDGTVYYIHAKTTND